MDAKRPHFIRRMFTFLNKCITGLRLLLVNLFFIAAVVVIITLISKSDLPTLPGKGALVLDIKGNLVDQQTLPDSVFGLMAESDPNTQETLLQDVIEAIVHAKDDKRINTMVLSLDQMSHGGISKMQEIAVALEEFRSSGKKIIAVGDSYSQDQYWLAAQADEIFMNPMGQVILQGYGVYRSYYKKALDKLSINFHVFRVGTYKSAMEPFMRNDMSEQAKEANLVWLTSLWNDYTGAVTTRRSLEPTDVDLYINTLDKLMEKASGDSSAVALSAKLIDGIKTRDQVNTYLIEQIGATNKDGKYQGIGFEQYLWLKSLELSKPKSAQKVGLIVASGMIVSGEQPAGTIGSDSLAKLISNARLDSSIKAVVLRVDSGGGSAFASEIIRRELELLKGAGKPLVISMGAVAASGGYWISALADQIWATSTTLTGSIGIFGAFPTIENTLGKIGITTDGVGTTQLSGALRIDRPLEPIAARVIQSSIENGYERFLDIVASGRSLDKIEVAKIAEGRVWSGTDAKKLGLVDSIGGLNDAIKAAAELASLNEYETKIIEIELSPQQQLLRELTGRIAALSNDSVLVTLQGWLLPIKNNISFIKQMNDPKGEYLFCSMCIAP